MAYIQHVQTHMRFTDSPNTLGINGNTVFSNRDSTSLFRSTKTAVNSYVNSISPGTYPSLAISDTHVFYIRSGGLYKANYDFSNPVSLGNNLGLPGTHGIALGYDKMTKKLYAIIPTNDNLARMYQVDTDNGSLTDLGNLESSGSFTLGSSSYTGSFGVFGGIGVYGRGYGNVFTVFNIKDKTILSKKTNTALSQMSAVTLDVADPTKLYATSRWTDNLFEYSFKVVLTPGKPTNLNTVKQKLKVGDSTVVTWDAVSVPVQPEGITLDQNKVLYELSLYNGSSWTVVGDSIDGVSRTITIPSMADTTLAKFRVRAFVLHGGNRYYTKYSDGTEYTTTSNIEVYNNNIPTVPSAFQTPSVSQNPVKTGTTLRVAWGASTDADGEAVDYELSYTQNGTVWEVVASNIPTTYYDHIIPEGDFTQAQYRVRAKDPKGDYGGYRTSTAFQTYDNTPPSNPGNFSFPQSEDILSPGDVVRIAFAPSIDPEGDAITYELDLSVDGGVNYVNVAPALPVAFTEYTFPQIAPTENAKYRVRSIDSNGDISDYSYSDTFRIWTTIPPEKPVLQLLKGSEDIPDIVQYLNPNIAWSFQDANKDDVQAHYQIRIYRRMTTGDNLVHDSSKIAGNFNVYAVPMNVIQWNNIYYAQVKVWDNKGGESEWSDRGFFKPNRSPAVTNLYPGALDMNTPENSSATPRLGWTFDDPDGDDQVEYFLTIHKTIDGSADDPIVYESGFVASNDRFHQIPEDTLEDGIHYHWRVTVNDVNGLMDTSEFEYIITNYRANPPKMVSPVDNHRVPSKPTFVGVVSTDMENDNFHISLFLKKVKGGGIKEVSSVSNPSTFYDSEGNAVSPTLISEEGEEEVFDTTGLTEVYSWEIEDGVGTGKFVKFPDEGVDNTFAGCKFRVTLLEDLDLWEEYQWYLGATDDGSKKMQEGSERRIIRVGNEIFRRALEPILTSVPATRIYLTVDTLLAKDVDIAGGKPSELIVEASNNALDENPTWENMTEEYKAGTFYEFINNVKTNEDWAVDFKVTIKAHDSQEPISIGMYGGTFE